MIPRTEVEAIAHTAVVADVLTLFKEELRERYPVCETTMDNIIGIVFVKQLLNSMADAEKPELTVETLAQPVSDVMMLVYYISDTMSLKTLLMDFTSNRRQIAIVLDEYGGTEGLITLEDILEEIVGDHVTLGRFINHRPGRIAGVGDRVQFEGACLEVLKMERRRNAGRGQAGAPNCLTPSQRS